MGTTNVRLALSCADDDVRASDGPTRERRCDDTCLFTGVAFISWAVGFHMRQLGDKIRVGPPDLTPEFNSCSNLHDLMLDEGYLNAKLFMFAPRFIVEGTKGDKLRSRQDCREEIDTTAP